jgi:hypothetical protein
MKRRCFSLLLLFTYSFVISKCLKFRVRKSFATAALSPRYEDPAVGQQSRRGRIAPRGEAMGVLENDRPAIREYNVIFITKFPNPIRAMG